MLPALRLIILVAAAAPMFLAGIFIEAFTGLGVIYLLILAAYVGLGAAFLPRKKHIAIKRITPERMSIGVPGRIYFEVENLGTREVTVRLAEELAENLEASPPECQATIKGGGRARLEYRLVAGSRGRHYLGDVYVRVLPLMGLLWRQFKVSIPAEIQVFPNLVNLRKYDLLVRRASSYQQGLARLRRVGQGSEFESLRHYVAGDEMSKIEWKASAKRGGLIVKNYQPERQQSVLVAIDVGRATAGRFGALTRVDYLVNAALMLAYAALRQNDWFSMVAFSDRIESYLPPISGVKNIDAVARGLFALQPRLVESDYGLACRFMALKNRKRSLVCVMTDVVDRQASGVIIAYMGRFARYHLPLAVTLSNPEVQAAANEPLAQCDDVHRKAAALDVLAARQEALIAMRQRGISVLDVLPEHLTPELINRYTLIKSRSRL